MELIIILLIAVEVVIVRSLPLKATPDLFIRSLQCLIRDGPELRNMLFRPKNEGHGKIVEVEGGSSSSVVTKPV